VEIHGLREPQKGEMGDKAVPAERVLTAILFLFLALEIIYVIHPRRQPPQGKMVRMVLVA
jgi:hypothetical protein